MCLDGSASEYFDAAIARGRMPHLMELSAHGYRGLARSALPSFTNTNNASIVTGLPPSGHGISGNFFIDPDSGKEVMMNSARYLRADTILAGAANSGRRVAAVTAKDKLRQMLAHKLDGIAFSAENAGDARRATHGIDDVPGFVGAPIPDIYSAEASLFVLRAGVALLKRGEADFLYLSTTDYIQHKHRPEDTVALDFYAAIDEQIGEIISLGARLGITADHGMNDKQLSDGSPNVIYLESELEPEFGRSFRVILPITDPYVKHHGSFGSCATIHLADGVDTVAFRTRVTALRGITEVHDRDSAARLLELPADRIGDLVVLSGRDSVVGCSPRHHEISSVGNLRSHGGRYEEMVPFLVSESLNNDYFGRAGGDVRNFDIFDFTINGG